MAEALKVLEDSDGQLVIDISAIMNQVGWTEETLLEWELTENGAILREADDTSRDI
jgi:hypothetical protein